MVVVAIINPSLDPGSPFTVHTCMCAESCPNSASRNLSRGLYMIKPASRKTKISNTKNIEVCDRHTDEERINVPCIQTYSWKKKLAVFMLPRFQGLLKAPKL